METVDAFTFFALGLALGFFLGAFVRKADRELEFEKGRLHGLNQIWPYFIAAVAARAVAQRGEPARDQADGGSGSDRTPVH